MHVDAVTIAWNVVATAGVAFSAAVLPQYWVARKIARDEQNHLNTRFRRDAVRLIGSYLWMETSRFCCHMISLTLGVWNLFVPRVPQVDRPHANDVYLGAFLVGIIAINCLTVANSVRAYLAWR